MTSPIKVDVQQLPHAEGLPLPAYQSGQAAGLDLLAAVPEQTPLVLAPGQHAMVPTGLVFALPDGFEAQVRPRSGLAAKHGVTVLNSPGTVDADYRGEINVLLVNLGTRTIHDPPRRAHRADGGGAGDARGTRARGFAIDHDTRWRRIWFDRALNIFRVAKINFDSHENRLGNVAAAHFSIAGFPFTVWTLPADSA